MFADDRDRVRFLLLLGDVVTRCSWQCHTYCLMNNHYHLVLETQDANLSMGMHRLNGIFAQSFNLRHELDGHLFQDRFHSVLVESSWHLLELSRYVVLNPVRAGICQFPGEWRWSSYRPTLGEAPLPRWLTIEWLLSQFGQTRERARTAYRAFVADGLASAASGPLR